MADVLGAVMATMEAPLAQLDGDDWQEFNDYSPTAPRENSSGDGRRRSPYDGRRIEAILGDRNGSLGSLADDARNMNNTTGSSVVPRRDEGDEIFGLFRGFRGEGLGGGGGGGCATEVQIEKQERTVNESEVWKHLSTRLEDVQLVTWPESHACQLQENSLELKDIVENNGNISADNLDLSDDEELQQCMDLHGLILSSECDVPPVQTADEIISEIEEMMDDECETEKAIVTIDGPSKTAEIIRTKLKQIVPPGTTMIDCLKNMSTCDLEMLQDDLEATIRDYSEVLIQELALREELAYQKELNNQFISLLLSIQRKRRQLDVERKKGKTLSKQNELTSVYLTTVIPYDDHLGPPDTDRLQIYLKIMAAIEEDSVTVPTLLTDYILKVLCPKT